MMAHTMAMPTDADLTKLISLCHQRRMALPLIMEFPLRPIDLLAWLSCQKSDQRYYLCDREGQFEYAGIGLGYSLRGNRNQSSVRQAANVMSILADSPLLFLCGRRFADSAAVDSAWAGFGSDVCLIPEWMILRRGSEYSARYCLSVAADSDIAELHRHVESSSETFPTSVATSIHGVIPSSAASSQYPDIAAWRRHVDEILRAIADRKVEKVVLARKTVYQFEDEIDPISLFAALLPRHQKSYAIFWQPVHDRACVSFSPERLYRRSHTIVEIDALSSTVSRGRNAGEDALLENQLRASNKQQREHRHVIDSVINALAPFCRRPASLSATTVMKLDRVQHLWTRLTGELVDDADDDQILAALHPTAAVGGAPRQTALEIIRRLEPFDRGWYAGPIGYMTGNEVEFAVGIRSCLVSGRTVSVFSGAGIVAGSDPETEWQELDSKDILQPPIDEPRTT